MRNDKNIISQQRFRTKLAEQLRFLQRSCEAFDSGAEDEGLRIALALRVMFHDTKRGTSLVSYLGLKDGRMLSSSRGHGDYKDYLAFNINLASPTPVRAIPMLKNQFHQISFNQWWKHEVAFIHAQVHYHRREIILSAVNRDGGAHVDNDLEPYYDFLCRGQFAFGITGDLQYHGAPPFEQGVTQWAPNAHVALIRQFAHETLASAKRYGWPNCG